MYIDTRTALAISHNAKIRRLENEKADFENRRDNAEFDHIRVTYDALVKATEATMQRMKEQFNKRYAA